MIINALNCGANVFMADFEDANSPTWANNIEGQINLKDRWAGKLELHRSAKRSKRYQISRQAGGADRAPARLASRRGAPHRRRRADLGIAVRFRPLLLPQRQGADRSRHRPLFLSAQARDATRKRGCGTTCSCSRRSGSAFRTARSSATVLIETLPAAFEMEEILYELRDHIAGLNAGRWDYIFSFIKKLARHKDYILPDRGAGGDGQGVPRRLRGAAGEDLPFPRRLRDGRHGGADPGQERCGRERGRLRQGARRQGARGARRL